MTTWAEFRDNVLRFLLDDVTTNRYDSETLRMAVNQAQVVANIPFGDIAKTTFTGDGSTTEFSLPADAVTLSPVGRVLDVALVINEYRKFIPELQISYSYEYQIAFDDTPDLFYILNYSGPNTIAFMKPPGDSVTIEVRYIKAWDEIPNDNDFVISPRVGPPQLAVANYAAYIIHTSEMASRANIMQWGQRPELPVGNPFIETAREFLRNYEQLVSKYGRP